MHRLPLHSHKMKQKTIRFAPWNQLNQKWLQWWRKQSPNRQDRLALLGPLLSVLLFLGAILMAFAYLQYEETGREQESVRRDVEYAQQRLRLRLIERQEQLLRLARNITEDNYSFKDFKLEAVFSVLVPRRLQVGAMVLVFAKLSPMFLESNL